MSPPEPEPSLRSAWESHAEEWIAWVRTPGHDSYDQFHRRHFFDLIPPPGRLTLDLGGGEGRLSRDLAALGHRVVMVDGSPTLAAAAHGHAAHVPAGVADLARLPVRSGVADLAVAFMSLHDVDDLQPAVDESARILRPGGVLCAAIVHPVNSAGEFEAAVGDGLPPFVMRDSYLSTFRYHAKIDRDGLGMTFHSAHRPFEAYSRAFESAGYVIEAVREVPDERDTAMWSRCPMFLDLRARKL